MSEPNTINILVVEDDEIAREGIRRALRKARICNPLFEASNGLEALEVLRGQNSDRVPRPRLVLLDLQMPRMNGFEFLDELRADAELQDTVVFVLTTSDADRDKAQAYDRHVAGYILKSRVGRDFLGLMDMLEAYWRIVELPQE